MKENGQIDLIASLLKSANFKPVKMKIMSRMDNYNGESRLKHQVLRVYPKNNTYESRVQIDEIEEYMSQGQEKNLF